MVKLCLADIQLFRPEPGGLVGAVEELNSGKSCCMVVLPNKQHVLSYLLDDVKYGINEGVRLQSTDTESGCLERGVEFRLIQGVRQIGLGTITG